MEFNVNYETLNDEWRSTRGSWRYSTFEIRAPREVEVGNTSGQVHDISWCESQECYLSRELMSVGGAALVVLLDLAQINLWKIAK